jgi:TRAP-type mannitol/chloroaromatic compound transport system substrate-binding protein
MAGFGLCQVRNDLIQEKCKLMEKFYRLLFISFLTILLAACGPEDNATTPQSSDIDNSKTYNWKMVTTWPPGFPVLQKGAERFADNIKAMSNGRLDIKVYAGGELIPPLQTFDAVSQGTVEMGHGSAYYWAGKVPEAQFFSTVPFGMTARGMNAWLYDGGGLELWREVYKPFHVIPFPLGNTGVQMGGWFNKEINSLEDIKGLKMRIPGLGGKVFAKAGGNPVLLAGSEVYTALERNTIDATEWIGPYHDQRLGLYRAAEHYYYPGWHEPGTVLELTINERAWLSLPADLQAIVSNAAQAENVRMLSEMEQKNMSALQELRQRENVQIHHFPTDVLAKLRSLTDETLIEEADKDPKFKHVFEAYQQFRQLNDDWSAISENAYLAMDKN